jgi:hypothetical protein
LGIDCLHHWTAETVLSLILSVISKLPSLFALSGIPIASLHDGRHFAANRIRGRKRHVMATPAERRDEDRSATMKPISILDWYRILRAHQQWTIFQSIRYALWLTR